MRKHSSMAASLQALAATSHAKRANLVSLGREDRVKRVNAASVQRAKVRPRRPTRATPTRTSLHKTREKIAVMFKMVWTSPILRPIHSALDCARLLTSSIQNRPCPMLHLRLARDRVIQPLLKQQFQQLQLLWACHV